MDQNRTAMEAEIVTNKRREKIGDMMKKAHCRLVEEDEIVTEIVVPASIREYRTGYDKYRVRDSHDFAVVSVASAYKLEDGKVAVAESCIWLMGRYRPRELRLSFTPGADLFVRVDMFGANEGPGIEEPCEHSLLLVEAMSKTAQVLEEDGAVVGLQLALAGEA